MAPPTGYKTTSYDSYAVTSQQRGSFEKKTPSSSPSSRGSLEALPQIDEAVLKKLDRLAKIAQQKSARGSLESGGSQGSARGSVESNSSTPNRYSFESLPEQELQDLINKKLSPPISNGSPPVSKRYSTTVLSLEEHALRKAESFGSGMKYSEMSNENETKYSSMYPEMPNGGKDSSVGLQNETKSEDIIPAEQKSSPLSLKRTGSLTQIQEDRYDRTCFGMEQDLPSVRTFNPAFQQFQLSPKSVRPMIKRELKYFFEMPTQLLYTGQRLREAEKQLSLCIQRHPDLHDTIIDVVLDFRATLEKEKNPLKRLDEVLMMAVSKPSNAIFIRRLLIQGAFSFDKFAASAVSLLVKKRSILI